VLEGSKIANRAVNPQLIGGRGMAAFALQPHVSEFLDVVMHDASLDDRIEEVEVTATSPLVGRSLADAALREGTGALLLAIRSATGQFIANPSGDTRLDPHTILIALGTSTQLDAVRHHVDAH
jgi:voltage-gated potassium channel